MSPYTAGWIAFLDGKSFLDNPFPQDSLEFRRWVDGMTQSIIDHRDA